MKQRINSRLEELIPPTKSPDMTLIDAARYSLNSQGKRLRPILTLATTEMLGKDTACSVDPACAIEMIHTYSMIHDDLPCMDDDDFRRGRPTLHKAYTEGTAVLAGDLLLTQAFQVLAEAPGLDDLQKVSLITTLSQRAGREGMIGGQMLDIEAEKRNIPYEELRTIHLKKTGALISASVEFGAIIAGASEGVRLTLKKFGETIGLAFQIIDDVLDVTQSQSKHGKKESSDAINHKSTYVSCLGLEQAKDAAESLSKEAEALLETLTYNTTDLQSLTGYIISRKL